MAKEQLAFKGPCAGGGNRGSDWPGWVPKATRTYLAHTESGRTIRDLAKEAEVHPSTMLRRVRRVEGSREDPMLDSALHRVAEAEATSGPDEEAILAEALPVLRRLAEPEAVLAVARDLEKAVVARSGPEGEPQRLAVVDQGLVVEIAIRDWIACTTPDARVQRYRITNRGRSLLKRHSGTQGTPGLSESPAPFAGAEPIDGLTDEARRRQYRWAQNESPLAALARRKDSSGQPFVTREHVTTGDRLREDFMAAQRDGATEADWEEFLERLPPLSTAALGSSRGDSAQDRVERALIDLGPGLADVVVRTCCLLEGLEQIERRLGWATRSGKVVLRIGLGRLNQHYRGVEGQEGLLIR